MASWTESGTIILLYLTASASAAAVAADPPGVTPFQQTRLAVAMSEAKAASASAEPELLSHLDSSDFKEALRAFGTSTSTALADKSAHELLDLLKLNVDTLDYSTNFNLEPWQQQWARGQTPENVDAIGWFANLWQLELRGYAPSCRTCAEAEEEFYKLKHFADRMHPNREEAAERGVYIFQGIHRTDIGGDWTFGHTAAMYRTSVMRTRALMLPGDSGQWLDKGCKDQPSKIDSQYDCSGFSLDMPAGVPGKDSEMHMILRQAVSWQPTYGGLAKSLAAIFHDMLDPEATVKLIRDCPEVMVLGSVQLTDLKMIVASFPVLAGTSRGDALIDFCHRHSLPLLWAFSDGHVNTGGYKPLTNFLAGRDRLLDPRTVAFTNGTLPSAAAAIWNQNIMNMRSARNTGTLRTGSDVSDYWHKASQAGTAVAALRGGACADTDLCFGTQAGKGCICRVLSPATTAPLISEQILV